MYQEVKKLVNHYNNIRKESGKYLVANQHNDSNPLHDMCNTLTYPRYLLVYVKYLRHSVLSKMTSSQ